VASTRSRSGGREHARPTAGGVAAEHATKIYSIAGVSIVVIVAFLALTSIGHVVDAATQHFMLFYAGVFALIALCASVGLGLVATDRRFLDPGHRVFIQAAHRAASFGAVTFLIIHIVTEILAQRVHVIDAVIPFLSPFRTFYIGLGTIASDLIILLVITGIMRGRFNASGKAWRWRAIHYMSYAALVFGIWHGLLGGRPAKPYVDWSYGFIIAFVALGVAVRILSNSLKPRESLSAPPVPQSSASATATLRAAAMAAQLGAARGGVLNGRGAMTGGQPMLSAPVSAPMMTATVLPAGGDQDLGQPYYEPGYEGPPRYLGAPRSTGTGPMPRAATGSQPRITGSQPRAGTGPLPRVTGPLPAAGRGPLPPHPSGPLPQFHTGPFPAANTGPLPPYGGGQPPRPATGALPRAATGPIPRAATGPIPRAATGPLPRAADGYPVDWNDTRWDSAGWGGASYNGAPGYDGGNGYNDGGYSDRGYNGGADYNGGTGYDTGGTYPSGPYPPAATGPRPTAGPGPRAAGGPPGPPSGQFRRPVPPPGGNVPPGGRMPPGGRSVPPSGHSEPPWEADWAAETDPGLRYREPGPGMPGYRGSRDYRYGGDTRR
jgi:DMSO/TMAO reductase YedYZ heme-binding membrane subunit